MHKFVLSGVAALALLAVVTGGRGAPVGSQQADAAGAVCHSTVAMADNARTARPLLVAGSESATQARRLLVAYTVDAAGPAKPAATMAVSGC
jgi:hypothetical protein